MLLQPLNFELHTKLNPQLNSCHIHVTQGHNVTTYDFDCFNSCSFSI